MYNVIITDEVYDDLEILPDEILKEIFSYFEKYETSPLKYSQKLYNKFGLELEGYRKTYVYNASYRIIIKIEDKIAKIVEVVAVGQRQDLEVYKEAHKRVSK